MNVSVSLIPSPKLLFVIRPLSVVKGKTPFAFHLHQNKEIIISTEAAHSLIVSGAAEKSASRPPPSPATSTVVVAFGIRAGLQPSVQAKPRKQPPLC